ncbi:MAG: AraC family transcriptional regulator ligand-binding domain-containing protein [Geminicoccaceae bacterium]
MMTNLAQADRYDTLAMARDRIARRCAGELERRGLSWRPLAREHGLDLAPTTAPATWVLARNQHAFLRDAERLAADPYLAWSLGAFDLHDLGVFGYATLSAPDLRAALLTMTELAALESEAANLALVEQSGTATLVQRFPANSATAAAWLHFLLSALSALVGPDLRPLRLGLPAAAPELVQGLSAQVSLAVEEVRAPVVFVTFGRHLLDRPLHATDERLSRVLTSLWREERNTLAARHAELVALADAIIPLLARGTPTPAGLAHVLGLSTAELQGKLDHVGSSLSRIVDAIRSGLAVRLLADADMTMAAASEALGLPDGKTLARAYRRWWGTLPRDGRKLARGCT